MRVQDKQIFRYLLGDLPEAEQTAIEQEYFSDPQKLEEVWAAENDLVDDYVRGRLSPTELELFERNYLQSPKHRERVALAEQLVEAADHRTGDFSGERIVEPGSSWWSRIMGSLTIPRFAQAGLAAAMLLLIAGLAWLAIERSRLNQELAETRARLSEQQRREGEFEDRLAAEREQSSRLKSELERMQDTVAQKTPPPAPPVRRSIFSVILSPMLVRGAEGPRQIALSKELDAVRLRMRVDPGDSRRFLAVINTDNRTEVWRRQSLKARGGFVAVTVPAAELLLGDYILTLSAASSTGETEEINRYYFRVIRK
jgi:hypothetical protein